jgi:hypothetical protein
MGDGASRAANERCSTWVSSIKPCKQTLEAARDKRSSLLSLIALDEEKTFLSLKQVPML